VKKLPEWYTKAVSNSAFFLSDDFCMLMDDAISEYNDGIKTGNKKKTKKWKDFILRWLRRKESNSLLVQQGAYLCT